MHTAFNKAIWQCIMESQNPNASLKNSEEAWFEAVCEKNKQTSKYNWNIIQKRQIPRLERTKSPLNSSLKH